MNDNIKLSIIVPVYKVEKYIRRCMDSLVNQTLKEIQIICIHDGSPDNCLSILREYEKKYKNILIFDKPNEGLCKARYDGIKLADGEYIAFVDSDDYVTLDFAEKLYNKAKKTNADICVCGFKRVDMDTMKVYSTEMVKSKNKKIDMSVNPEDIICVNTSVWNKIYKATLLKQMETLKNMPKVLEDVILESLTYARTNTITFVNDSLYYYMVRQDSIIQTLKKEDLISFEDALIQIREIYENKNNELLEVLDAFVFLHLGISLTYRLSYDKKNFKRTYTEVRKFLDIEFPNWRKCKYLSLTYCIKHNFSNIKVAIMKKIYILGLYKIFLFLYRFSIDKLKIDIKW